jgi:hypothetical protein
MSHAHTEDQLVDPYRVVWNLRSLHFSSMDRVASTFAHLSSVVPLRVADAIHLACAADAGVAKYIATTRF